MARVNPRFGPDSRSYRVLLERVLRGGSLGRGLKAMRRLRASGGNLVAMRAGAGRRQVACGKNTEQHGKCASPCPVSARRCSICAIISNRIDPYLGAGWGAYRSAWPGFAARVADSAQRPDQWAPARATIRLSPIGPSESRHQLRRLPAHRSGIAGGMGDAPVLAGRRIPAAGELAGRQHSGVGRYRRGGPGWADSYPTRRQRRKGRPGREVGVPSRHGGIGRGDRSPVATLWRGMGRRAGKTGGAESSVNWPPYMSRTRTP